MNIEAYIKENAGELCGRVYIAPEIPDKKMNGAIAGIAPGVDPDYVLAIADTTVFGSAKEGCLFTGEYLYVHAIAGRKILISLAEIKDVEYEVIGKVKDNGKTEKKTKFIIKNNDGSCVNLSSNLGGINTSKLNDMLKTIIQMANEDSEFVSTSQTAPLSMMDEEVKKNYIKVVCNFAFSDDQVIDAKEYAEIMSLLVRIEMESKKRVEIRGYMTNHENALDNEVLISELKEKLSEESFEMVKKSLVKDVIFISRAKNRHVHWKENQFIVNMVNSFGIADEQVDLIENAIINDEEILDKRKNDSEIKKSMKDMVSKAAAVGVPLAAIYLSGSVVGVSAAGITSGLATLGLGGALGFSSMFTGIGVAVLIGVGTYQGLKKITGISDLENNKQRELMLQAIIRNSQKSLNYLIEDVNEITRQLTEEIKKGVQTQMKIEELTTILGMLSDGAKMTSEKIDFAEREKTIVHLPLILNITRLNELTNSATKMKFRTAIMACYELNEEVQEDGSTKEVYRLSDELSSADLNHLESIFEGLGYNKIANASVASVKGAAKNLLNSVTG